MSAEQNIRTLYEWVQYLKTQLERLKGKLDEQNIDTLCERVRSLKTGLDGLAERVSQIEKKVEGKEKEGEKGK